MIGMEWPAPEPVHICIFLVGLEQMQRCAGICWPEGALLSDVTCLPDNVCQISEVPLALPVPDTCFSYGEKEAKTCSCPA